jgi:hypothetical protein
MHHHNTCASYMTAQYLRIRHHMQLLHSGIAFLIIVHPQKIGILRYYENNPPDGFLEYQRDPHSPPEGSLS